MRVFGLTAGKSAGMRTSRWGCRALLTTSAREASARALKAVIGGEANRGSTVGRIRGCFART